MSPSPQHSFKQYSQYLSQNYPTYWTALAYHRTHKNKPITLQNHQYLKPILLDKSNFKVIMKSTQCGISEVLIIMTIEDAKTGRSIIYALPTFDIMRRFVTNRFEKSVLYTPYYQMLMAQARVEGKRKVDNVALKDIGEGVISFAGSNTPVPFIEFPGDTYVIDEEDQCHQENIKMGEERLGHSDEPRIWRVSNPTIPRFGIDVPFDLSDKKFWTIRCECGERIFPDFFKHVVREVDESVFLLRDSEYDPASGKDVNLICDKCGRPVHRFAAGSYESPGGFVSDVSGYQISRLYSGTHSLKAMVEEFDKALTNDWVMQRFYNSWLGLPYSAAGAKITREVLLECLADFSITRRPIRPTYPCVMGVDVGKVLHVRVNELLPDGRERAIFIGEKNSLEDLALLFRQYKVVCAVIDALPETRLSKEFCVLFPGHAFRCFFGTERKDMISPTDRIVTVDRTQMLDEVKEKFLLQQILLPKNAPSISDYFDHLESSVRVWDENKQKYFWENGSNPDHYLLAEGYALTARKILKLM